MQKGTFGHMQKVQTQTSPRVSDAASGQGLHFLTLATSMAHIFLLRQEFDNIYVFNIVLRADLGLHYLYCPKVPFRVTLANYHFYKIESRLEQNSR